MRKIQTLIREALELPADQRARLAERLLESLDRMPEEALEKVWMGEALRRVEGYREGRISSKPAAEVHEELRRRIG